MAEDSHDDSWKDAHVRQAEAALASAVRTADEIIADAQRGVAEEEPPVREEPPNDERPSILYDAW